MSIKMISVSNVYIGTSGWSYNNWIGKFYPKDLKKIEWLKYYAKYFNTVEINYSFYHLPKKETLKKWLHITPANFLFILKASRYITHIKRLVDCNESLIRFLDVSSELGEKLGPILFQMPPNMKKDKERLKKFLEILPKNCSYAFEFRDESWFCNDIYRLLNKFRCAIVISSSPKFPIHYKITGNFCYMRMHGNRELYSSSYTEDELRKVAKFISKNQKNNIQTYIYFNNDIEGYAVDNAKLLLELIS
ncbi:MAG: DUF72 domain-containing protein [Actinobacteria bacterium]|nr:DUF72 domain-containing protein [Actinomycetota bacterium]MBL7060652.1 DUF72 domain-containing protein [Actinomycetota bacterium]